MRQNVVYEFPSPPDPALNIIRRELAVRVNGQRNPAQPIRVGADVAEVLIGTFPAAGGEDIEIVHQDIDSGRRKTPVATVRFKVPSPPALTAPAPGRFRVDQVFDPGELDEGTDERADEGPADEPAGDGTDGVQSPDNPPAGTDPGTGPDVPVEAEPAP